ncbi:MAG: AAA family ATPase [Xanthobacteraceae bacterium]
MELKGFQIFKYRNIQDSGLVDIAERLTCIVGKNQSGKTSLLKALHKFNPRDKNVKYDLTRDWPRGERRGKDPKQIVCRVVFGLEANEKADLAAISDGPMEATVVEVTKNYAGEFEVKFPERADLFPKRIHPNEIDRICEQLTSPADQVADGFKTAAAECIEETRRLAREGRFSELS